MLLPKYNPPCRSELAREFFLTSPQDLASKLAPTFGLDTPPIFSDRKRVALGCTCFSAALILPPAAATQMWHP